MAGWLGCDEESPPVVEMFDVVCALMPVEDVGAALTGSNVALLCIRLRCCDHLQRVTHS